MNIALITIQMFTARMTLTITANGLILRVMAGSGALLTIQLPLMTIGRRIVTVTGVTFPVTAGRGLPTSLGAGRLRITGVGFTITVGIGVRTNMDTAIAHVGKLRLLSLLISDEIFVGIRFLTTIITLTIIVRGESFTTQRLSTIRPLLTIENQSIPTMSGAKLT